MRKTILQFTQTPMERMRDGHLNYGWRRAKVLRDFGLSQMPDPRETKILVKLIAVAVLCLILGYVCGYRTGALDTYAMSEAGEI